MRFPKTTGAPICIEIKNKDFENWKIPMSPEAINFAVFDETAKREIEEKINEKSISKSAKNQTMEREKKTESE